MAKAFNKKYVKTPTIYQMEYTECGAASLAMVMATYGKYVPLDQLRVDTGVRTKLQDKGQSKVEEAGF